MSQEASTNLYMNRRCEPMGGELDTNNRNVPIVGGHSSFTDSSPEDNFIDELTLKVRSLLKSWEDDFPNDDSSNSHQIHDITNGSFCTLSNEFQIGKSTLSSDMNFASSKIVSESRISNELKCNFNVDMNDTLQSLKKTSTPIPTIQDPLSYNDFSNLLQDARNISSANKNNINVPFDKSVSESSRKTSLTERNSNHGTGNLHPNSSLNAAASTDLYSRESSDKETERSWSEITIVAESYSESSKNPVELPLENLSDFQNANSLQPASFEKPSKALNSSVRVKNNIKTLSRPTNVNYKDVNVSTRDWRIEISDHNKTSQDSDKEYQFSDFLPSSNMSDLDQIDRDTPPLSASSMASSKRLEWDNGADIGYNVADMRSKVKYRSIPRSEPEGISFINEAGTNTASSKVMLPSFSSMNSQDEPASMVSSRLDGLSSETSSVHEPSAMDDLLERSSSPGSLSRSDSKKSVIYNSFKNTLEECANDKAGSPSDPSFMQTQRNSSWPDLTVKSSGPVAGWQAVTPSKMLSKSDELVGSVRCSELKCKKSHFPGFTASGNNNNDSTDSFHLPERILPIGDYFPSESQSVPKQNSIGSISHSCKNCQSPLSGNVGSSASELNNQMSGDLYNLQEGDLESYEIDSESPNVNQTNHSSQFSEHDAEGDWTNENVLSSDFSYITELPELADNQLHSLTSRPFLLLRHDSSRLKGSYFPNIAQNLFGVSNSGDHSTNGNLEVKPHIRWYPFPSNSNLQDIKNVSTQTSVSFIAKQQTDSLVQVSDQQINHRDVSHEAYGSNFRGDSSTAQLGKSVETLDNSNLPSSSTLSKASAVINKETVKPEINLNERSNTSFAHYTPLTSEVAMTASKTASGDVNQVDDKLYLSKPSNSSGRNSAFTESCMSHKYEVEKQEKVSLTHPTSSLVTSNKSAQYQLPAAYSDTKYDSDDSTHLHTNNIISQPPSKYLFSGDLPVSFAERRVGVGQCQTSPDTVASKFSRDNFGIQLDMQTKETRNSSTENLSDSTDKNDSVFSRYVSSQFDNESANYGQTQSSFKQNLDDTILLSTAYTQRGPETSDRYNASPTIPLKKTILNPSEKVNGTLTDLGRRYTDVSSGFTNNYFRTETNLSRLLSEDPSFSISRHKKSIIPKSHSDPLLSFQNSEANASYKEDKNFQQSQLPSVNRKLDFELSGGSETDSYERISHVEASLIKYSSIKKDDPELHQSQNSFSSNLLRETASNSFFYDRGSFNYKSPLPSMENITQSANLPTENPKFISDLHKSLLKEQRYSSSRNKSLKPQSTQILCEHPDVVDEVLPTPSDIVESRLKYFEVNKRNYASVGIQVSRSVSGLEKCSFCHKSKDSHMNCCVKKEIFKSVLNQTLAKRVPEMKSKSATSFCVYPSGCYCCCNKTLQEAFNFHRSEIVDRIELRKKEVEKCKKKIFLHVPQTKTKQPVVKLSLKPVAHIPGKTGNINSNKENKRIKKHDSSWRSTSSEKGRQKNLNKYNRIMSKIYSQRLKNETLKGKVNHQRHETLINS